MVSSVSKAVFINGYFFKLGFLEGYHGYIIALHTANQAQEQARGTAQDLTPQQRKTLADLDDGAMTYRKLARRALKPRPQLLEKLGIKA